MISFVRLSTEGSYVEVWKRRKDIDLWLAMALGPGLLGFYRVLVRADNDKSRLIKASLCVWETQPRMTTV